MLVLEICRADGRKVERSKDKLKPTDRNRHFPGPARALISTDCLNFSEVGVTLKKLTPFVTQLNTHLAHDMVTLKEDPGEGRALQVQGLPRASR